MWVTMMQADSQQLICSKWCKRATYHRKSTSTTDSSPTQHFEITSFCLPAIKSAAMSNIGYQIPTLAGFTLKLYLLKCYMQDTEPLEDYVAIQSWYINCKILLQMIFTSSPHSSATFQPDIFVKWRRKQYVHQDKARSPPAKYSPTTIPQKAS